MEDLECAIIGGWAIQLLSLGSITVNYKNLTYICSPRNVIFTRLIKVLDPQAKLFHAEGVINKFST